jgi:hypothetical protein
MSKAGPSSSPIVRIRSGRKYWVRDTPSPDEKTPKVQAKPASPGKKRFVEPHRLTDEQRANLLDALEAGTIGDAESRALFAAALEYDLAPFLQLTAERPAPEPAEPKPSESDTALTTLAEAASGLAAQLARLDGATKERLQNALGQADLFHRRYGDEYLDSVREELLRIVAAGPQPTPTARQTRPKAAPLSDATRRFLRRVADAFTDCFELRPTPDQLGPFATTLKGIADATGIPLATDSHTLKRVLNRD